MSNRPLPILKPLFFTLHHTLPAFLPARHISIRPYTLNNLVLLDARKDLGDRREEAVVLVRCVDSDVRMREREGDFDLPSVVGGRKEGEKQHFEVSGIPVGYCALKRESAVRQS